MNISENAIIQELKERVIQKCKKMGNYQDLTQKIEQFSQTTITPKIKIEVYSLLYLLTLYSDGYVAVDPRARMRFLYDGYRILDAKTDNEVMDGFPRLEQGVNVLKEAETKPIQNVIQFLQDKETYKDMKF